DPLFRSAADQHGARVIGVILSGGMSDGAFGVRLVKREGGVAIAQHPDEAIVPNMPLSAIRTGDVDHIARAAEIGPLISRLTTEPVTSTMKNKRGKRDVAVRGTRRLESGQKLGPPTVFTCPDCGGTLWEKEEGELSRFECHVGHSFTTEALASGQD